MRFQKGNQYGKKNSRKGVQNKTTAEARKAISEFVDGNAHRLQKWLDQVADGRPAKDTEGNDVLRTDGQIKWEVEPNPEKAFQLFQSVVEYHIPKLARTETDHSGDVGLSVNIVYPDADKPSV